MLTILLLLVLLLCTPYLINGLHCESNKHLDVDLWFRYNNKGRVYKVFNPSLTIYNGELIVCARRSTWAYTSLLEFLTFALVNTSRIYFIGIDIDTAQVKWEKQFNIATNLEDPRICTWTNSLWMSVLPYNVGQRHYCPILYEISPNFEASKQWDFDITLYAPNLPHDQIRAKNWCPVVHQNELYIHTDATPIWTVCKVHFTTTMAQLLPIVKYDTTHLNIFGTNILRCSTSWVLHNDYYIVGLHDKFPALLLVPPLMRSQFVKVCPKTLIPIATHEPFCIDKLEHNRIQFLSGLVTHGKYLYMGVGLGNYKIGIYRTDKIIFN